MEFFGNHVSKCPNIKGERKLISFCRVPYGRSDKVKTYFIGLGTWDLKFGTRDFGHMKGLLDLVTCQFY